MNNGLPKGMMPPMQNNKEHPTPLTLADGNYAAAIRQALSILPVVIRVDRCLILEQDGKTPEVRLTLTILEEKPAQEGGE